MELTLLAAPNETLLTELYGWGEVPFDWINARGIDFEVATERAPNHPIYQTSTFAPARDCDYSHIYMFPVDVAEHQRTVDKLVRDRMEQAHHGKFKIQCIHDGVECYAFM